MKAAIFKEDIPSTTFDISENHYEQGFHFTSLQVAIEMCESSELTGRPLALEQNFSEEKPLLYSVCCENWSLRLQLRVLVLSERMIKKFLFLKESLVVSL